MFVISVDSLNGTGKIKIGKSRIGTHRRDLMGGRNSVTEYLRLIKYDQFINAKTGDKTFINELGKEIERASTGYDPENVYDFFRAGKRLDKALMKNPIYRQMKTSFDKAYEEYKKTFVEFRQSEDDRMDHFQQKKFIF